MAKSLQHQIVARALELIADEPFWTSLIVARTAEGSPCGCMDPHARFCAIGALYRAAGELLGNAGAEHAFKAERFILVANDRLREGLARINDAEGHAVIVAMFKRALAS